MKITKYILILFLGTTILLFISAKTIASSHNDSGLLSYDSKTDIADVYGFVSPERRNTVTVIVTYNPFQEPARGYSVKIFDDNALYEIKIDNNGDAKEDVIFRLKFKTTIANPNTFLYNFGGIDENFSIQRNINQTYTISKIENETETILGENLPVTPFHIGPKSTPDYAKLYQSAIVKIANGIKVFAGLADDPFFGDRAALSDLLTIRKLPGNAGGGIDSYKGYNVNAIALQVPIKNLTKSKKFITDSKNPKAVIGIWATVSKKSTRVFKDKLREVHKGKWIQVSRAGSPFFNEFMLPLRIKDRWNNSTPANDVKFINFVANPELGTLLKILFGLKLPPQGEFGTPEQRDDLTALLFTGFDELNKPKSITPSEQLRLNTAVLPSKEPNLLGLLANDKQGYPNGRRLTDDVTDIFLRSIAGAFYSLFHEGYELDPTGGQLGDGVDKNDVPFLETFPYLAMPHRGFDSLPHLIFR